MKYEIHITIDLESKDKIKDFESKCAELECKPLVIELPNGDHPVQPMLSKVVDFDFMEDMRVYVRELNKALKDSGFKVSRSKIEIPLFEFNALKEEYPLFEHKYFEYHCKVKFDSEDTEELKLYCKSKGSHLSRNSLKDGDGAKFITIRSYSDIDDFQNKVHDLIKDMPSKFQIKRHQFECCIIDSNIELDKGWI